MIIEYKLKASSTTHRGFFSTNDIEIHFMEQTPHSGSCITGCSQFIFRHENEDKVQIVYEGFLKVLRGGDWEHEEIGFIRRVC